MDKVKIIEKAIAHEKENDNNEFYLSILNKKLENAKGGNNA